MKIQEIVNCPRDTMVEICKSLGYEEYRTHNVNFVKYTPVGRIHIILDPVQKTRTRISIHHDIQGSADAKDHYTRRYDGTARKAWDEIQAAIYFKRQQKITNTQPMMCLGTKVPFTSN
jgi:hypothetical protein